MRIFESNVRSAREWAGGELSDIHPMQKHSYPGGGSRAANVRTKIVQIVYIVYDDEGIYWDIDITQLFR